MKTMGRNIVQAKYSHAFDVDGFEGGNQLEEYTIIAEKVKRLLKGGAFHFGGTDKNVRAWPYPKDYELISSLQGKTNNISHPCIAEFIIQFYYRGDNALAKFFPDDFKDAVPDHAVALVLTCVKYLQISSVFYAKKCDVQIQNCLEEWEFGYKQGIKFSGDDYKSVQNAMLDLIDEVKGNSYHGAKYEANRRKWARVGM
jgi:WD40 repeat protein